MYGRRRFTNHSPGVLWGWVSEWNSGVIFRFLIIFRDAPAALPAVQHVGLNKGGIAAIKEREDKASPDGRDKDVPSPLPEPADINRTGGSLLLGTDEKAAAWFFNAALQFAFILWPQSSHPCSSSSALLAQHHPHPKSHLWGVSSVRPVLPFHGGRGDPTVLCSLCLGMWGWNWGDLVLRIRDNSPHC